MHEYQEVQVDHQLREVLAKEGIGSHELTESDRFLEYRHCVVDAERVKDSCQEHVFSDKSQLAISLHKGLGVL